MAEHGEKAAKQSIPTTGDTEALRLLREDVEKWTHMLALATFRALTKLGRTTDVAKVDLTPSDLSRSRAVALAGTAEVALEEAEPLSVAPVGGGEAPGKISGITLALVARVDGLWARFGTAMGAPARARAKRAALTGELPDDSRAIEALLSGLDDLVIQFAVTEEGQRCQRFVNAWFQAWQVVDLGKRAAKPKAPAAPAAPKPSA